MSLNFKNPCNLKTEARGKLCEVFINLCLGFVILHFKENCTVSLCEKMLLNTARDKRNLWISSHGFMGFFMIITIQNSKWANFWQIFWEKGWLVIISRANFKYIFVELSVKWFSRQTNWLVTVLYESSDTL